MKTDKKQTMVMIGITLLVLAGVLLYISFSQPKVYVDETTVSDSQQNAATVQSSSVLTSATATASTVKVQTTQNATSFPVNINTATVSELIAVPNLGEKRASDIIAYREAIGGYTSVSQIKNIKGIGDKLYSMVSPYLTV